MERSGALGQGGLSFFVATAAVNGSNFVFHVLMSRLMGPSGYGALTALINVLMVLTVPMGAIQAAVTQAEAKAVARGQRGLNVGRLLWRSAAAGGAVALALVAASGWLAGYLHLGSAAAVVVLAVWLVPALTGAVVQGVLIGRMRFAPVGVGLLAGSGIGRLVLGAGLVLAGGGVAGAVAASVAGQMLTTAVFAWVLRRDLVRRKDCVGGRLAVLDGLASVVALGGYWVLAGVDAFLVRHLLPAHEAGIYAAGATAGRIALFLPGAVAMVYFPKFVSGRGAKLQRDLAGSLAAVGFLAVSAAAGIWLFGRLLTRVLFGAAYAGAVPVVEVLGVAGALLSLVSLLMFFHLARRSVFAVVPWGGAGLAAMGISWFHSSSMQVAAVMVVATGVAFVVSLAGALPALAGVEEVGPGGDDGESVRPGGALLGGAPAEVELSIVVPFYNPGPALRSHVSEVTQVLESESVSFEVIAVADGCTDGSPSALRGLRPDVLRCIELEQNGGKGHALKVGLGAARGEYVGFIDGDGDIPAELLAKFVELVRTRRPDIVTGSKRHPDSKVVYPPLRRVYSWGYQQVLRTLFQLDIADTQTGVKLIRREVLAAALPRMIEKRYAFDLELFVVAKHLGYRRFEELPVVIRERFSSTVSLRVVRGMLLDTLAIFYRLHVLRWYSGEQGSAGVAGDSACQSGTRGAAVLEGAA